MIRSFRHKGLEKLHHENDGRKLPPELLLRLRAQLTIMNAASRIEDMDLPGYRLHGLKGDRAGQWAITVRANWRLVFRFDGTNFFDVDFIDYH
jgi:toxin HigB-1